MNDARVLVVGSEDGVAAGWVELLRQVGASISVVSDGMDAVRRIERVEPDLVLLDLQLAGQLDGFDTCRAIRDRSATILVVAAPSAGAYDEVVALALGADHFVTGDIPAALVVARLRALLRRARGAVLVDAVVGLATSDARGRAQQGDGVRREPLEGVGRARRQIPERLRPVRGGAGPGEQLTLANGHAGHAPSDQADRIVDGDLSIDLMTREVHVAGTAVALTRIEFDLLVALARNPRRVLTRDQLMASAWEVPFDGSHVLDAHLSRLRGKITRAGGERVGHAVRGVGYRLRA